MSWFLAWSTVYADSQMQRAETATNGLEEILRDWRRRLAGGAEIGIHMNCIWRQWEIEFAHKLTQGKGRKGLPRMCDSLGSRNNSKISITDESKVLESVEAYRHTHKHILCSRGSSRSSSSDGGKILQSFLAGSRRSCVGAGARGGDTRIYIISGLLVFRSCGPHGARCWQTGFESFGMWGTSSCDN